MAFFDSTPLGRILTRFSRDIDEGERPLPAFAPVPRAPFVRDLLWTLEGAASSIFIQLC